MEQDGITIVSTENVATYAVKCDDSPYGSVAINSYCHAWSATPTYLIRKYL